MILYVVACLLGGAVLSAVIYVVGVMGTKEVTFEEAVARQKELNRLENPQQTNAKKTKGAAKPKSQRPARAQRKRTDHSPAQQTPGPSSDEEEKQQDAMIQEQQALDEHEKREQEAKRQAKEAKRKEQEAKRKEQEAKKEEARKKEQEQLKKKEQEKKKAQQEAAELKRKEQEKEDKRRKEEEKATAEAQKRKQKKAAVNGVENGVEAEEKPVANGKTAVLGFEDMAVDVMPAPAKAKPAPTPAQAAPAPKKNASRPDKASVKSVLDFIEKNPLPADQINVLVNSLLALAADGGWSEARKTADSAMARKLEDAVSANAALEEAKAGLTSKITGLRTDLNAEKSKVAGLKSQLEEAEEEKGKAAAREKSALDHLRSQLTQQAAAAVAEERARWEGKVAEAERGGAEEARAMQGAREHSDAEARLGTSLLTLQTEHDALKTQKDALQSQCDALQTQYDALQSQHEGLQAQLQSAPSTQDIDQANARLREAQGAVEVERDAVTRLTQEVADVRAQLSQAHTKHDELRAKNTGLLEALKDTEARLQSNTQSASTEVAACDERYRELLRRLFPSVTVAATDCAAFMQQFESAAAAVAADQQKAAEEPVVEVVEKVVECPKQAKLVEELKATVDRLEQKVKSLESELAEAQSAPSEAAPSAEATAQLEALKEENAALKEETAKFRRVLDDTETSLRALEASVTAEELKWQSRAAEQDTRLQQKEQQIQELQAQQGCLKEVTAKKEELEAEVEKLRKEKASSSNGPADDSSQ